MFKNKNISKGKIGVLVIALGRYDSFWPELYRSCEKYFLPEWEKQYFVFTDNQNLKYKNKENVTTFFQKKMGWPWDSMMRFEMFYRRKPMLEKCDYLFFLNINLIVKKEIGEEILPTEKNDWLLVCTHSSYYNKPVNTFPYDRNPLSTAYIPYNVGKHYAPGGFNGGRSAEFLEFCSVCAKNVRIDMKNNVIALWHDESHLNKYILDKNPLIAPINYMYPKNVKWLKESFFSKDIRMELRDKVHYGGHYYLRGAIDIKNTKWNKLKYHILRIFAFSQAKKDEYDLMITRLYYE